MLDGAHGNRIQIAPRERVKPLVAAILQGEDWNEAALDESLRQMDVNSGPPMIDVRSLIGASAHPLALAPRAPVVDPLLRFFLSVEQRYVKKHSSCSTLDRYVLQDMHPNRVHPS